MNSSSRKYITLSHVCESYQQTHRSIIPLPERILGDFVKCQLPFPGSSLRNFSAACHLEGPEFTSQSPHVLRLSHGARETTTRLPSDPRGSGWAAPAGAPSDRLPDRQHDARCTAHGAGAGEVDHRRCGLETPKPRMVSDIVAEWMFIVARRFWGKEESGWCGWGAGLRGKT